MKRKTAHANVAQAVQLRVIWAMMEDLSKGNDTPFTGVTVPGRKTAPTSDPDARYSAAQGAGSESKDCGQRKRAACPTDVRA
ncbi:hypothetical protein E0H39_05975 [Rhizobium leguminosarum bv. viciae]|uniref:Uncharacterized protein n=1 Tax=Rhizobium leguminosarum TaxID=384 RepID=A0A7M3DYB1_RHILE|nr:hypothetical protein CHR56_17815 [Rhizobium leguminosarum bv. viciae]OOO47275.1 hypothetical protein BS629_16765 [Rhizobium leguminosarum bv. viciae USDA 2370]RWX36790.1 hypothetical protein EHH54_20910 [Rhizobium leguminosarum]NKJ79480.1 hypothetical protein [Rhizobium leguminosarum bv. viciae]NKK12942.1 hypothetical protein [Rhizobium leguminosarum bv. viciae]